MSKYVAGSFKASTTKSEEASSELASADFDVQALLDNAGLILQREIRNLSMESTRGKLSAPSSRDLVAYLRLLNELKAEEQDKLANMTDEQLQALKGQTTSSDPADS